MEIKINTKKIPTVWDTIILPWVVYEIKSVDVEKFIPHEITFNL